MDQPVEITTYSCRPVPRTPEEPFPSKLHPCIHPANVDAGEAHLSADPLARPVRRRLEVADADDEWPVVRLHPKDTAYARVAPLVHANIGRPGDAGFRLEERGATHHVDTVLEEGVLQRPVPLVTDQRRAQEPCVSVIARAVDAERRAETPCAHAADEPTGSQEPLSVDLHRARRAPIRVGGRECHAVGTATHRGPRPFSEDP